MQPRHCLNAGKHTALIRIFLCALMTWPVWAFAQKQGNTWYFAVTLGMDFNTAPATVLLDGKIPGGTEGTGAMSDKYGRILFYANGEHVWNRRHEYMKNGSDLMGNFSSVNGALIVPKPGENNKYYIFTTGGWQYALAGGLRRSLVDMCGDNGYGEVVAAEKNIPMLENAGEKLAFTRHSNGVDYWVVAHLHFSSDFYVYQVTESGVSAPTVYSIGTYHGRDGYGDAIGQMKFSVDGTRLALVMENRSPDVVDLFDFNTTTGAITNYIDLGNGESTFGIYGVSFSPNGKKLYFCNRESMYQYSLDAGAGTRSEILASQYKLADVDGKGYANGMQLGPDDRIYINQSQYLAIIRAPNLTGAACLYTEKAVDLFGRNATFEPPAFLESFQYPDKGGYPLEVNLKTSYAICPGYPIVVNATSSGENVKYLWDDGSTDPSRGIYAPGSYHVKISDRFCTVDKDILVAPIVTANNLGDDISACEGDTVTLAANVASATSYLWSTGETSSTIEVTSSGRYWLDVTANACKSRDSIQITFNPLPRFNLGNDTILCNNQQLTLYVNAIAETYQWQDGSAEKFYVVSTPGKYTSMATSKGCSFSDAIDIGYVIVPGFNLGTDTVLCAGHSILLSPPQDDDLMYRWSDQSAEPTLLATSTGIYWVDVGAKGCMQRDTISIVFDRCVLTMPNIFTPNPDDHDNPRFVPMEYGGVKSAMLWIYNRWGEEIFKTNDLLTGWDGRQVSSSGEVFYYVMRYTDVEGSTHVEKGTVTLNR